MMPFNEYKETLDPSKEAMNTDEANKHWLNSLNFQNSDEFDDITR